MRVQLSQCNPTVGDLIGNTAIIKSAITRANATNCDVLLLPEMVTTAYPPRDLLCVYSLGSSWIWEAQAKIAQEIHAHIRSLGRQMTVVYGGLEQVPRTMGGFDRYNVAYIIDTVFGIRTVRKHLLPTYDIFDEGRYFTPCPLPVRPVAFCLDGNRGRQTVYCDVLICEDIWNNRYQGDGGLLPAVYARDPVAECTGEGPLFVINGSPFWRGKIQATKDLVSDICLRLKRQVCWVNQVGGHDDIVTGGYSMVAIPNCVPGKKPDLRLAAPFCEDDMVVELADGLRHHDSLWEGADPVEEGKKWHFLGKRVEPQDFDTYCDVQAMILFERDYLRRCGFDKVVLGLSGGIDSAVCAAISALAIGGSNVIGARMPSEYSSQGSLDDAEESARLLGLDLRTIPIKDAHQSVRNMFLTGGKQSFNQAVTDENIQPRLRALILMAISNDENAMLLTTGNKSEASVGYCTLYGDMCGGIGPIMDSWKTEVFAIARFLNKYSARPMIPERSISKPPSADLKRNPIIRVPLWQS